MNNRAARACDRPAADGRVRRPAAGIDEITRASPRERGRGRTAELCVRALGATSACVGLHASALRPQAVSYAVLVGTGRLRERPGASARSRGDPCVSLALAHCTDRQRSLTGWRPLAGCGGGCDSGLLESDRPRWSTHCQCGAGARGAPEGELGGGGLGGTLGAVRATEVYVISAKICEARLVQLLVLVGSSSGGDKSRYVQLVQYYSRS